jgi:hypothetical protein
MASEIPRYPVVPPMEMEISRHPNEPRYRVVTFTCRTDEAMLALGMHGKRQATLQHFSELAIAASLNDYLEPPQPSDYPFQWSYPRNTLQRSGNTLSHIASTALDPLIAELSLRYATQIKSELSWV